MNHCSLRVLPMIFFQILIILEVLLTFLSPGIFQYHVSEVQQIRFNQAHPICIYLCVRDYTPGISTVE
jgi:hypothetical protein